MFEHVKLQAFLSEIRKISFYTNQDCFARVGPAYYLAYRHAVQLVDQTKAVGELAITTEGLKVALWFHLHAAAYDTMLVLLEKISELHDQGAITDEQLAGAALAACEVEHERDRAQEQLATRLDLVCRKPG